MAEALVGAYTSFANSIGDRILQWAGEGRPASPTQDWPMASFPSALAVVIGYLSFVVIGKAVFSNSSVPKLDNATYPLRFVYNITQVMLCSYMCIEAGIIAYRHNYSLLPCEPFNAAKPPVANVLWMFYISKILDFLDTVFIVLAKNWRQLSFLHVYHHTTIFLFYWLNVNLGYDGDVYLTVVLNGFIHTVMYTYYFLSMHTKDIWWKRFLTMLQMIQFMMMNAQAVYLIATGCQSYPRRIILAYLGYILSLLFLFLNFFIKSYITKPSKKDGSKKNGSNGKTRKSE